MCKGCHQVIALTVLSMIRKASIPSPSRPIEGQIGKAFCKIARYDPHGWDQHYPTPMFLFSASHGVKCELALKRGGGKRILWSPQTQITGHGNSVGGGLAARRLHAKVSDLALQIGAFLEECETGFPDGESLSDDSVMQKLSRDDSRLINDYGDPVPKSMLECKFQAADWTDNHYVALWDENNTTETVRIWTASGHWRLLVG